MKTKICKECGCIGKPSKGLVNFHNIQTQDLSKEFVDKFVNCLKCPNCGHSWIPEKSTREKALEWWNNISPRISRWNLQQHYYPSSVNINQDKIEYIWRQELQKASAEYEYNILADSSNYPKQPQVDFEMLKDTIEDIDESLCAGEIINLKIKEHDNLQLFFHLLSTKPTFAIKAHEELNKLNK